MDLIDVKSFLRHIINKTAKHIKHDHGLCISNLSSLIDKEPFTILKATNEQIDIVWKKDTQILMEANVRIESITIKDYTYVIPPFYTCQLPTHLHPHAVA